MKLDAVTRQPADGGFGGRFYLVGYLPTYAAALFLLVLVWAGARGPAVRLDQRISFTTAWATASHLSLGEAVILVIGITLLAVVVQPLQLAMVRMAEGSWPAWLGSAWARHWQEHHRKRLRHAAHAVRIQPATVRGKIFCRAIRCRHDEISRPQKLDEHGLDR